jgi:molybdopterin/thiamine biosynthesis adenylyltransferase
MRFSAAIPTDVDLTLKRHLLRRDGQEDLCFAMWFPSKGTDRCTFLVSEAVLPGPGERRVHGNASFEGSYVERVLSIAASRGAGVAFLHSHLGPGWQGMSSDDVAAESSLAPAVFATTGVPLVGLTLGTDGAWSARTWERGGRRQYDRQWCESVRVVGDGFRVTYNNKLLPVPAFGTELTRTISAWGEKKQADIARLRIGVVGTGSVGCIVAEAAARMGVGQVLLMDFDSVEEINLDRLLHSSRSDIGRSKVAVLSDALRKSATAKDFSVFPSESSIVEEEGFRAALDCDLLFSCVDRPWPRFALNLIAYAHLIPVIDGGLSIVAKGVSGIRHCSIRSHIAAPSRRCLECLGQYKSEFVSQERDGLLDDPKYIGGLPDEHPLKASENVFGFSAMAASMEVMQMLSMIVQPSGIGNVGAQIYHFTDGTIDKVRSPNCETNCFFRSIVARGDRAGISCTSRHLGAEQARSTRHINSKLQSKRSNLIGWISRRLFRR